MAATRTSKNSSRLLAEIERNFKRSRSGLPSSNASSSTRRSNAIHEVSRLRKYCGLSREMRAMEHVQTFIAVIDAARASRTLKYETNSIKHRLRLRGQRQISLLTTPYLQ